MRHSRIVAAAVLTLALALSACSSADGKATADTSAADSNGSDAGEVDGSTNTDLEAAIDAIGPQGLTDIIANQIDATGTVDEAAKTITFAFDMSEDFSKVLVGCQVAQSLYNAPDWQAYAVNMAFTDSTVNCQELLGDGSEDDGSNFFEEDVDYDDEGDDYMTDDEDDFVAPVASDSLPADLPDTAHIPDAPLLQAQTLVPGEHWSMVFDDSPAAVGADVLAAYRGDSAWTEVGATEMGGGLGLWTFSDGTFSAGLLIAEGPTDGTVSIALRVTQE